MQKSNQTPGATIKSLLEKHDLNCNRLAKAINMSNAMVRLLILDKSPISVSAAYRLAKFFKNKPSYWLNLQMDYDLAKADNDKELAKEVNAIVDVSEYAFVRKPHGARGEGKEKEGKAAAGKKKEAAPAGKRKAAAKAPASKAAGAKKTRAKS